MSNEERFWVPIRSWRAATALQVAGVVLIALASRLDLRHIPIAEPIFAYLGILALVVGTIAIFWAVITARISDRQGLVAFAVAGAIDLTGFIALLPMVQ
jgi:hypothetical protein